MEAAPDGALGDVEADGVEQECARAATVDVAGKLIQSEDEREGGVGFRLPDVWIACRFEPFDEGGKAIGDAGVEVVAAF